MHTINIVPTHMHTRARPTQTRDDGKPYAYVGCCCREYDADPLFFCCIHFIIVCCDATDDTTGKIKTNITTFCWYLYDDGLRIFKSVSYLYGKKMFAL